MYDGEYLIIKDCLHV